MDKLMELQTTIFLLIAAGYLLTKWNILTPGVRKPLTDLVIDFVLPCNIIVSFMIAFDREILISCLAVFGVSVAIQLVTVWLGRFLYPKTSATHLPVLRYATIVSNAGFLGNPIVEGLYGSQGLLYASIYLIPQRIVMWSAGVSCFTATKGKDVLRKVVTHPCIVAVAIGLVLMLFQIDLPVGLDNTLRTVGACNTALSMLVIGNILSEVKLSELFHVENIWYCVVRLLLIPALVLVGCKALDLTDLVTQSSTILAGMPAAATTAILAAKYDGDAKFAVSLVCLSTLLSLITIPMWWMLMNAVM